MIKAQEAKKPRAMETKRAKATAKHWQGPIYQQLGKQNKLEGRGPCFGKSCTYKCSSTFSQKVREKIFANYGSIGDKREQKLFILKHVERHLAKRKRVGSDMKNVTFKNTFTLGIHVYKYVDTSFASPFMLAKISYMSDRHTLGYWYFKTNKTRSAH